MRIENVVPDNQSLKEVMHIPVYLDPSFSIQRRAVSYIFTGSRVVSSGEARDYFNTQREKIIRGLPDYKELKDAVDVLSRDAVKLSKIFSEGNDNGVSQLNKRDNKAGKIQVVLPSGEIIQVSGKIADMIKVLNCKSSISKVKVRERMEELGSVVTLTTLNTLFVKLTKILANSRTEIIKEKEPGRHKAIHYKLGARKPIEAPFSSIMR